MNINCKRLSATFLACGCWLHAAPAWAAADVIVIPWQDKLGNFLTNPWVATILLTLGFAGVIIEAATVGSFGGFGVLGIVAFTLYFLGSAWNGSLTQVALILLAAGVVLLAAEIFFVPGFGVPGGLGILATLTALVLASPTPEAALWELLAALVAAGVLIWYCLKSRKTRAFWQRLTLQTRSDSAAGYDAADTSLSRFQGQTGVALTTLRPAGIAAFGAERCDVVTTGDFIEAGTPVRVLTVEGARVVVERIPAAEA